MAPEYLGDGDGNYIGDDEIIGAVQQVAAARGLNPAALMEALQRIPAGAAMQVGPRRATGPKPMANIEPNKLRCPLGVGFTTFDATHNTEVTFQVEPQREFVGKRLVVDVQRSATGVGGVVLISVITCGDQNQSPSSEQPMPASMFSADATSSFVDFDVVGKGTKFVMKVFTSVALAGADTLSVAAGLYGEMVRGGSR